MGRVRAVSEGDDVWSAGQFRGKFGSGIRHLDTGDRDVVSALQVVSSL